ncbi:MAG: hypothetical protein ACPGR8_10360, partial [Limisphaerales bacterium]
MRAGTAGFLCLWIGIVFIGAPYVLVNPPPRQGCVVNNFIADLNNVNARVDCDKINLIDYALSSSTGGSYKFVDWVLDDDVLHTQEGRIEKQDRLDGFDTVDGDGEEDGLTGLPNEKVWLTLNFRKLAQAHEALENEGLPNALPKVTDRVAEWLAQITGTAANAFTDRTGLSPTLKGVKAALCGVSQRTIDKFREDMLTCTNCGSKMNRLQRTCEKNIKRIMLGTDNLVRNQGVMELLGEFAASIQGAATRNLKLPERKRRSEDASVIEDNGAQLPTVAERVGFGDVIPFSDLVCNKTFALKCSLSTENQTRLATAFNTVRDNFDFKSIKDYFDANAAVKTKLAEAQQIAFDILAKDGEGEDSLLGCFDTSEVAFRDVAGYAGTIAAFYLGRSPEEAYERTPGNTDEINQSIKRQASILQDHINLINLLKDKSGGISGDCACAVYKGADASLDFSKAYVDGYKDLCAAQVSDLGNFDDVAKFWRRIAALTDAWDSPQRKAFKATEIRARRNAKQEKCVKTEADGEDDCDATLKLGTDDKETGELLAVLLATGGTKLLPEMMAPLIATWSQAFQAHPDSLADMAGVMYQIDNLVQGKTDKERIALQSDWDSKTRLEPASVTSEPLYMAPFHQGDSPFPTHTYECDFSHFGAGDLGQWFSVMMGDVCHATLENRCIFERFQYITLMICASLVLGAYGLLWYYNTSEIGIRQALLLALLLSIIIALPIVSSLQINKTVQNTFAKIEIQYDEADALQRVAEAVAPGRRSRRQAPPNGGGSLLCPSPQELQNPTAQAGYACYDNTGSPIGDSVTGYQWNTEGACDTAGGTWGNYTCQQLEGVLQSTPDLVLYAGNTYRTALSGTCCSSASPTGGTGGGGGGDGMGTGSVVEFTRTFTRTFNVPGYPTFSALSSCWVDTTEDSACYAFYAECGNVPGCAVAASSWVLSQGDGLTSASLLSAAAGVDGFNGCLDECEIDASDLQAEVEKALA